MENLVKLWFKLHLFAFASIAVFVVMACDDGFTTAGTVDGSTTVDDLDFEPYLATAGSGGRTCNTLYLVCDKEVVGSVTCCSPWTVRGIPALVVWCQKTNADGTSETRSRLSCDDL